MTDAVRKNDVVLVRVQQLSFLEQHAGEPVVDQAAARSPGAVHDQHGVGDAAQRIPFGLAEIRIVNAQLGQRFSRSEMEIMDDVVALERPRIQVGGMAGCAGAQTERCQQGARVQFA